MATACASFRFLYDKCRMMRQLFVRSMPVCGATLLSAARALAFLLYPAQKTAHCFSVPPHVAEKLWRVQVGSLRSVKRFETPTKIGASPRTEAITFGGDPVVANRVQQIGGSLSGVGRRAGRGGFRVNATIPPERLNE